jgi:hypothetical protein
MSDFLDVDASREVQRVAAVDYAKLYVATFVNSPAGAKLLKEWDERCVRKRVPVNAPHTEYAATEAVRQFVNGIYDQIRLAQNEGR